MHIKNITLSDLKLIAIQCLFLATFGLASYAKLVPIGIPESFTAQFADTWINWFPGGIFAAYYTLALLETAAFVFFIISIYRLEFLKTHSKFYLKAGLILSLIIFVLLTYGLRLTGQFQGTANTFFYFGVTLFALYVVEKEEPKDQKLIMP